MSRVNDKKEKGHLLTVIVPAYKQENTIYKDLQNVYQVIEELRYPAELICVVDGKLDNTFQNATAAAKKYPRIRVVGYETNKGKGYAVRYGMARSKGDIVAFIDGGMDINPNGLSILLEHMIWYDADIIVGSKRHPASKIDYPWQRRIISIMSQLLIRMLFGLKVKDTQAGIKFYRREVLEKTLPRLLVKEFAFDVEILAVANSLGFTKIYEAPVELNLKFLKSSSIISKGFFKTLLKTLRDTLAVFYRLHITHYYSDKNKARWQYDPELDLHTHT